MFCKLPGGWDDRCRCADRPDGRAGAGADAAGPRRARRVRDRRLPAAPLLRRDARRPRRARAHPRQGRARRCLHGRRLRPRRADPGPLRRHPRSRRDQSRHRPRGVIRRERAGDRARGREQLDDLRPPRHPGVRPAGDAAPDGQGGDPGRADRARPRARPPRLHDRHRRAAGPGAAQRPRGRHARPTRVRGLRSHRRPGDGAGCRAAARAPLPPTSRRRPPCWRGRVAR